MAARSLEKQMDSPQQQAVDVYERRANAVVNDLWLFKI